MSADSICAFLCAPVRFEEIYSPPELGDCVLMEQSSVPGGRGGLRSALPLAARLCRFHKAKRLKEPPGRKNVQFVSPVFFYTPLYICPTSSLNREVGL